MVINQKRGQVAYALMIFIAISLAFILISGTILYLFGILNSSFQGDIQAGQVNLTNASDQTFGKINNAFLNNADIIGMGFLFGLIIGILLGSYLFRNSTLRVLIIVDLIILIAAYILAVYISNSYESILNQIPYADLFTSNFNKSSTLLLNLPLVTIIIGAIAMVLAYSGIPRSQDEEVANF